MINVAGWNVRSITNKLPQIFSYVKKQKIKLLCLLETWNNKEDSSTILKPFLNSFNIISTNYHKPKRGVVILYNKRHFALESDPVICKRGWSITAHLVHLQSNTSFSFTGLYSRSDSHPNRVKFLLDFFSDYSPSHNYIVFSDFNAVLNPEERSNYCSAFDYRLAESLSVSTSLWGLE